MAAARKHEEYLKNQLGTISGTVTEIQNKKASRRICSFMEFNENMQKLMTLASYFRDWSLYA